MKVGSETKTFVITKLSVILLSLASIGFTPNVDKPTDELFGINFYYTCTSASWSVDVRSGPANTFPTILRLPVNKAVNVILEEGDWVRIQFSGDAIYNKGWIWSGFLCSEKQYK